MVDLGEPSVRRTPARVRVLQAVVVVVAMVAVVLRLGLVDAGWLSGANREIGGVPDRPHIYDDGHYAFMGVQPRNPDLPVGYNPCRPVQIVVNYAAAPADFLPLLQDTIAAINKASGLHLTYAGASGLTREGHAWDGRILIGFGNVLRDEYLSGYAGVGGSLSYAGPSPSGTKYYVGGDVTLNSDEFNHYSHLSQSLVLSHELGHAIGLAHTSGSEVMNPGHYEVHRWGHGDLTGLALLGSLPCQ